MPKLADGLLVSLPSGSQEYGPIPVPDANSKITIRLARATSIDPLKWPNKSTTLNAEILASFDGGASYEFVAGIGAEGGIHVMRDGTEAKESTLTVNLREGKNRLLRVKISVENGPLVTNATFEAN